MIPAWPILYPVVLGAPLARKEHQIRKVNRDFCWGGNISKFDRERLEKIVKKKKNRKAGHVVGMTLDSCKTLYEKRLFKKK